MGDLKVCRICLNMNIKMYNLQKDPLGNYYEAIIGINTLSTMELPPFACYECAALLKKYYYFRDRCLRGQAILYGILHMNGTITEQEIQQINRASLQVTSNYIITEVTKENVFYHNYEDDNTTTTTTIPLYYTNNIEVKMEPILEMDNNKINIEYSDKQDDKNKLNIEVNVKEEDYFDALSVLHSTDDDEPLSLHKSNKAKKTKKKDKKKGRREKRIKSDDKSNATELFKNIDQTTDDTSILSDDLLEMVHVKRKRGRPSKSERLQTTTVQKPRRTTNTGGVTVDEIDLEDYVEVVKLSLEEQMEEINKRKQSSNYLNAQFQCNLCYKGFIDTRAWQHHVAKHDPSAGDIECPICKFRFKTKRTLQKHASNHEMKYACKSCSYVSKTATQAKQHHRWHKGVTYKCQYCDEVSTKWTSYLSHVRIKHPSEFICGVCGYSFVSKLGLTMHKTMMHKDVTDKIETDDGNETGPYCEECDVKFISVEAYKRHMVTSVKHTQTTHFNNGCRVCGESFKNSEDLRIHHRKEHARKRPKNYGRKPNNMTWPAKCEHCSEEIPNAREYWTHFRRVHPDKNYPIQKDHICDICGKSFRGNAFLVYHTRTHFEEKAFKCSTCGKAFHNRINLHMHEKTHSDVRPYPCTVCFKAFKCKGALDRHFRCHTGVKPYECEVCGKAFGQSNSRKLHVRTVHLKQPAPYVSRSRQQKKNNTQLQKEFTQTYIYN